MTQDFRIQGLSSTLLWLAVLLTLLTFTSVEGQYDDVRCKCVCPQITRTNSSTQSRKIYVQTLHEPSRCKCELLVEDWVHAIDPHFCDRCDCQWQRRNTMTIKVVVIFIICIVSLLVLYMLFLLCLDPLLAHRHRSYTEHHNEEVAMQEVEDSGHVISPRTGQISPNEVTGVAAPPGVMSRVKHEVRRVHGETQRWRSTVQEQRKNIYDRHTMLN